MQPAASPSQADPILRKVGTVLDSITKSAPGMIQTLYLLARIRFLSGGFSNHVIDLTKSLCLL